MQDSRYHYVYRITNIVLNKHYYGSRSSKVRPEDDLGIVYFSSSKDKDFIKNQKYNKQNYFYKVIRIFNSRKDATTFEIKLHEKFDVGNNEYFYNRAKQTSVGFDTTGKRLTDDEKELRRDLSKEMWSDLEFKQKMSYVRKNQVTDEFRKTTSEIAKERYNDEEYMSNFKSVMSIVNSDISKRKRAGKKIKYKWNNDPQFIEKMRNRQSRRVKCFRLFDLNGNWSIETYKTIYKKYGVSKFQVCRTIEKTSGVFDLRKQTQIQGWYIEENGLCTQQE